MEPSLNRFNTTEGPGYATPGLINVHPTGWTHNEHYSEIGGFCGQSCPCCRAEFQEAFGSCPICLKKFTIINNDPDVKKKNTYTLIKIQKSNKKHKNPKITTTLHMTFVLCFLSIYDVLSFLEIYSLIYFYIFYY